MPESLIRVGEMETVPLGKLKPYSKNPRRGNVSAIADSLNENGQFRPIVVQHGTNTILAGNHTFHAAKHLGWKEISVVFVEADDEQAKRIVLADNKTADLGAYDDQLLAELLADMQGDYTGTGYQDDEANALIDTILQGGASTDLLDRIVEGEVSERQEHATPPMRGAAEAKEGLEDSDDEDPFEPTDAAIEQHQQVQKDPDSLDDFSGQNSVVTLRDDITFESKLPWHIPELQRNMLIEDLPEPLITWAGKDATPDDGKSFYLYNYGVDSASGMPWDRTILGFYTHDRFFESWWEYPSYYVTRILQSKIVGALTPNFSIYDYPDAGNLFNTYRSRWIGRFMQECGIRIIPDIQWKDSGPSLEWITLGIPVEVPWLSVQLQSRANDTEEQSARDLKAVLDKLRPNNLLVYSGPPGRRIMELVQPSCNVKLMPNRAEVRRGTVFDRKKQDPNLNIKKARKQAVVAGEA